MDNAIRYEIDQATAAALTEAWREAGMPDAIAVWTPGEDSVEFRDRAEVIAGMEAAKMPVPPKLRTAAQCAQPPMLRAFWVAVLLPDGVQYARVSDMQEGASA